ncbi:MAG TPA: energy-coupling factor ABC transporter ATP-binding protein [Brevibacterium senegalense]|uniref:Energy-coupling factor ABC transporter ATP-binding protein n=1 Tax=Brevibacterium senegalense TaxID=1033736 RepID=A0A921MDD6_9MICO|nr:energy-coupling factor ABC transporter ATP-binding protein [Brevibacterium senegalense]
MSTQPTPSHDSPQDPQHHPQRGPQPPAVVLESASVHVDEAGETPGALVRRPILTDITCTLTEPTVSIVGANGSGKSTLLQLINGLVPADSGRVLVDGLDVAARGREVRRRVGFVFTDPAAQLVMPTPLEDVELSLKRTVRDRRERRARALDVLDELGVADLAQRSVYELSGGQRQLVALAAVLAVDPAVLVLDEPTTLLDLANRERLRTVLADLVARRGVRTIVSTHDLEVAQDSQRTLLIHDGRLHADGEPAEVVAAYRSLVARDAERGSGRA